MLSFINWLLHNALYVNIDAGLGWVPPLPAYMNNVNSIADLTKKSVGDSLHWTITGINPSAGITEQALNSRARESCPTGMAPPLTFTIES